MGKQWGLDGVWLQGMMHQGVVSTVQKIRTFFSSPKCIEKWIGHRGPIFGRIMMECHDPQMGV